MADQAQYSISDLAHYSGIKAHTIRIWEKRFNLLNPSRTLTNIRGYGSDELRKLININTLLQSGWKISKVVHLNEKELDAEIRRLMMGKIDSPHADFLVNGLIVHMLKYDELKFVEILKNAIDRFGIKKAVLQVIYPFLKRIGVLWQVHDISPAQEHFASAIIKRKLLGAIDAMPRKARLADDYGFILCLPSDEFHELPLLLAHYILLEQNIFTIYLGGSVPPEVAAQAAIQSGATHLFTLFMSASPMDKLRDYLMTIHEAAPKLSILFSGCPDMCKKPLLNASIKHLANIEEFEQAILEIKNSKAIN